MIEKIKWKIFKKRYKRLYKENKYLYQQLEMKEEFSRNLLRDNVKVKQELEDLKSKVVGKGYDLYDWERCVSI